MTSKYESIIYWSEEEQIREDFIHGNYLSQQDVETAKKYPVEKLASNENYVHINALYIKTKEIFCNEK